MLKSSQEVICMTLEEMLQSTELFVTPSDVAPILHCDPQCIRNQAQLNPSQLGFPVIVQGSRVRIPRIPFLRYIGVL